MNAWWHLPNAQYIDRVIESVNSHPEIWGATSIPVWSLTRDAARGESWYAAWDANRNTVWDEAWDAVKTADRNAVKTAAVAARDAILALVAWDDSAKYLDMTSEQLRVWAIISEDPAATLLLPAIIAFERINELETV